MTTHVMTSNGAATSGGYRPEASGSLTWLNETIAKFEAWLAWNARYRQTRRELEYLSDRELDDIGIARYDIPMIAREAPNDVPSFR